MYVERLAFSIAAEESEPTRFPNRVNPRERLRGDLFNRLAPFASGFCEDLLGDCIRRQKRTAAHHVSRRRIRLSQLGECQRKRDRDRSMFRRQFAAAGAQRSAFRAIESQVFRQRGWRFFDECPGLVQR
jgi:hypothetical protein